LQLLKEKQSIGRLFDLLNILREHKDGQKLTKDANHLSYNSKDYDPRVDWEIEGMMVSQVVVDFGSQINILPRETWVRMGRPNLAPTLNYLKLAIKD
jgi:hypothetical protein